MRIPGPLLPNKVEHGASRGQGTKLDIRNVRGMWFNSHLKLNFSINQRCSKNKFNLLSTKDLEKN